MLLSPSTLAPVSEPTGEILSSVLRRSLFVLIIVVAAIAGALSTDPGAAHAAAAEAGLDLVRLLRLMALIKAAIVVAVVGVPLWRLGWPVSAVRFSVYALAGATMAAGPCLIWNMAHVVLGALFLHAGLAATVVLMWRDPAVLRGMDAALQRRATRSRTSRR